MSTVTGSGRGPSPGARLTVSALAVYLAARAITTVFVWIASTRQAPYEAWTGPGPVTFSDMALMWDGTWYRRIIEGGYPSELPLNAAGEVAQNAWAFYPFFPGLVGALSGATGLSIAWAGIIVAGVAGAGAAVAMTHLFRRYTPAPVALAAMALWACQPAAPTLQIAYTEALATLVLVLLLTALLNRQWLLVALLAVILGLTRPIAVPLVIVFGLVLLREAWQWWQDAHRPWRSLLAPLAAFGVTGLSGLLWPTIGSIATGRADAYAVTMASWRSSGQIVPFRPWIDNTAILLFPGSEHARLYAALAVLALAVVLLAAALGPWAWGLPMELRAWMIAYPAYLAAVLDVGTSLIRYAVPLFPLALVLIGGGARRPPRWWPVLALVLVPLAIYAQYHWTMGLLVFTPPSDYPP
ncbi:MAG: hypothetical protein Q4G67_08220 [Actinomycetia bacterium]|nr:hypothetical protein [Actinomycetes bacterium]